MVDHPLKSFRAGRPQTWLAALLGVDKSTISRWESGARTPDTRELVRIAKKTGIAAADLLNAAAADR